MNVRPEGLKLRVQSCLHWLATRKIECLILSIGVLFRLSMISNYHYSWNYDTNEHWAVVEWILKHRTIPNTETVFSSFHPPLYYVIAASLVSLGLTRPELVYFSVGCGILRLILTWVGLELWLPRQRVARLSALALASVLSIAIHVDGMNYAEPMSGLLHVVVFVLAPFALGRSVHLRLPMTLLLGLLLGLALLTKISALVMLGALLLAAGLELLGLRQSVKARLSAALPWGAMLGVTLGMSSWYYMQNIHQYGRPMVTSFDLPSQNWLVKEAQMQSALDRRSLGYIFGFGEDIFKLPFRPSGLRPGPRFFPVAIASAVVDYWDYGFVGYTATKPGERPRMRHSFQVLIEEARAAMLGGTVILIAMIAAWLAAFVKVWRRRSSGQFFLLVMPLFMLVAALQFAIVCPVDDYGVVKAAYMMFPAPVLFALFGLAVEWTWRRSSRWPLLVVLCSSLLAIGWYSYRARLCAHYPWESVVISERQAMIQGFAK